MFMIFATLSSSSPPPLAVCMNVAMRTVPFVYHSQRCSMQRNATVITSVNHHAKLKGGSNDSLVTAARGIASQARRRQQSQNGKASLKVARIQNRIAASRHNISESHMAAHFCMRTSLLPPIVLFAMFATLSPAAAQSVSFRLLDHRAGAASVALTGTLTATTYVPPFSVLTITISGSFPSGNFDSLAEVATSKFSAAHRIRAETWFIPSDRRNTDFQNDNFRSNMLSYTPYQTNSPDNNGFIDSWAWSLDDSDHANWFIFRLTTAICPTLSGIYNFR